MRWLDSITNSKNECEQTLGDSGGEGNLEFGKENAYMLAFFSIIHFSNSFAFFIASNKDTPGITSC